MTRYWTAEDHKNSAAYHARKSAYQKAFAELDAKMAQARKDYGCGYPSYRQEPCSAKVEFFCEADPAELNALSDAGKIAYERMAVYVAAYRRAGLDYCAACDEADAAYEAAVA